jgi:hypothetical protein
MIDPAGDQAIGPHNSRAALDQALAAWESVPCTNVRATVEGERPPASFSSCDGVSQVSFNDPFDDIDDPVDCVGILGVGGVCGTNEERMFLGSSYAVVQEGDAVIANGFGSCPFWNIPNLAEILTHEIGHALGLAHSSNDPQETDPVKRDATMYYRAHFDYRGAYLGPDDRAAICSLYPRDNGSDFATERGAVITAETDSGPRQRLLLQGEFQANPADLSPDENVLFLSARAGRDFLVQVHVLPDQWLRNLQGNRWRFRSRTSEGVTIVDLVRKEDGRFEVSLLSRRSGDPIPLAGQLTFSITLGDASATRAIRLRQGQRALLFP